MIVQTHRKMVFCSLTDKQRRGNPLFLDTRFVVHLSSKRCAGSYGWQPIPTGCKAAHSLPAFPRVCVCDCVCVWGVGVVACMFFWSLFHLLFIFAVARSRSHVPPGACQVSGNQSEWLILPAHAHKNAQKCSHTHKHTRTHERSRHLQPFIVVCPVVFYPLTVHRFIPSELSVSRTLILMERWNVWRAPG